MTHKRYRRRRSALRFLVCVPLLLMTLFLTAATPNAIDSAPTSAVPTAAPISPVKGVTSVAAAELVPAFTAQPAPTALGDTFSDVFTDVEAPADSAAELPVEPETQTVAAGEDDPNRWEYKTSAVEVTIDRRTQGDFVYFAADIRLTDISQFSYAFAGEKFGKSTEAVSDIADRHDPLIAINGDYCGFHDHGVIIRGGELFRKQNSSRALLIVGADGKLSVLTDRTEKQGLVAQRLMNEGVWHTFEFGPVLVENGEAVTLHSTILRVEEGYLEPRTAIGQYADDPLHYLVIVVDGRREGYSEGCDLPTLQQLFVDYGVETAFNLDGGGSTTLYYNGEIINRPAAGEERKVSDIIMFMREANP